MAPYNTKQRKTLTDYLEKNADRKLTADEIFENLEKEGISRSAVYRNLAELESEGKLHKSAKEGSRKAYYQYVDAEECKGALHLECLRCGKTIHMNTATAEALVCKVQDSQGFVIDRPDTIVYGTCRECREEETKYGK